MPNINSALLARLQEKLGVGKKAVYRQIKDFNVHMLEPNIAALAFAGSKGIGITRYSTADERAELRGALRGSAAAQSVAAVAPATISRSVRRERPALAIRKPKENTVFVVHGRNESLRVSMFAFLRSIALEPIEWEKAVAKARGGNPYVGDVLRKNMLDAQAIVVLFTPDELAQLKAEFCKRGEKRSEGALSNQARPNVIFEAGWAVGAFPKKTVLVQVGKMRGFSDIGGKLMVHLGDDPATRKTFANRLKAVGCKPDTDGTDWLKAGKFKV